MFPAATDTFSKQFWGSNWMSVGVLISYGRVSGNLPVVCVLRAHNERERGQMFILHNGDSEQNMQIEPSVDSRAMYLEIT